MVKIQFSCLHVGTVNHKFYSSMKLAGSNLFHLHLREKKIGWGANGTIFESK